MDKEDIKKRLVEGHDLFTSYIQSLNDHDLLLSANGKWTAGQQLDHIYRSVSAVKLGLSLPKFVLKLIIGKANRPSKDYDGLVAKYQLKLGKGGRAKGRFIPKAVDAHAKTKLAEKLGKTVIALCRKIDNYNEEQLDFYILPHPLLGKLTVREMLYFTIYHAEHHHRQTIQNLAVLKP